VDDGDQADLGLRARKKQATRLALSVAALRLAMERGVDNVRVDDIAAAAGVSPRTYNNYFSSREEAICVALAAERSLRVGEALRARPADEPLTTAIIAAMVTQYAGGAEPDRELIGLIASAPALRGEFLKTLAAIERPLAEAIAARTDADYEQDIFPRVLAAAVSGAARVATEDWLRPDSIVPFDVVLRAALTCVLPPPEPLNATGIDSAAITTMGPTVAALEDHQPASPSPRKAPAC
jgi:AcrR family transcriptional regulator